MPAFIKTDKDEERWSRAKKAVRKQYPNIPEGSDKFWALTNSIYQKMSKKASSTTSLIVSWLQTRKSNSTE
jgi:hypothetical protein